MKPLVTLVSPVYNCMPYLPDFLACLREQTWRPLQVILVDDGSADGSAQCLREQKPLLEEAGIQVELVFAVHGGQAAAFNAALPRVAGEFFTWCDSDDRMTPDNIEKKVLWLQSHPDVGMVRNNGIVMDADKGVVLSQSARETDKCQKSIFEELFLDLTYCYAGCYMMRKELFFAAYPEGQIPVSLEGQNLQMLLPPASRTRCGWLDEALMIYRIHSSSHAHHERSLPEMVARAQGFYRLRLSLLPYCECDRDAYRLEAEQILENFKKNMLKQASYLYKAKKSQEKRI